MAWPHPVVGIAAKFADAPGRRTHKAHVRERLRDDHIKLIPVEKWLDFSLMFGFGNLRSGFNRLNIGTDPSSARCDIQPISSVQNLGGNILDAHDKCGGQSGIGQFLVLGFGPEAILEVIVLHRTMALNLRKSAVVVGEDEPLRRNHLCGTTATKEHDGILEAGFVDRINVFGGELQAHGLHVLLIEGLEQRGNPHALRCAQCEGEGEREDQCDQYFLQHSSCFKRFGGEDKLFGLRVQNQCERESESEKEFRRIWRVGEVGTADLGGDWQFLYPAKSPLGGEIHTVLLRGGGWPPRHQDTKRTGWTSCLGAFVAKFRNQILCCLK